MERGYGALESITHREWSLDLGPDAILVLHLSGRWRVQDHHPSRAAIEQELRAHPPPRSLAFDTRGLDDSDSGFVIFVRRAMDIGRQLHLDADLSGLPAGVLRLLDLAAAGSEAETGRDTMPVPFLARLGDAAIHGAGHARVMVTQLGETCVALGRFACGRARLRRSDLLFTTQEAGPATLGIVSLVSFLVGARWRMPTPPDRTEPEPPKRARTSETELADEATW